MSEEKSDKRAMNFCRKKKERKKEEGKERKYYNL
jgi:hypothetical protein